MTKKEENQEIPYWKKKFNTYQESYRKSAAKDKTRQRIKLKVKAIEYNGSDRCVHCNREIKKIVYTDKGAYGYRCYLTAIGLPTTKRVLDISDFPKEAFEDLAETAIHNILKTDIEVLAKSVIPEGISLKYPILYQSFIVYRYYPQFTEIELEKYNMHRRIQYHGMRKPIELEWNDVYLGKDSWTILWEFTKLTSRLKDSILKSKTFNKWIRTQYQITSENPLGLQYTPFLKKYGYLRNEFGG